MAEINAEPVDIKSEPVEPTEPKKVEEVANSDAVDDTKPNDLEAKIIRQVEYYFSDFNLQRDKFLRGAMSTDDGWVPMCTMLKFKRLSELSGDSQAIIKALKKSTSELMEINEDGDKIRRSKNKPVPEETEEYLKEVKERTVYCKGFPKQATTLDKLIGFFASYPKVENVKMRHFKNKDGSLGFKGTLTATFSTKEQAENFLKLESVKYNEYVLKRQWCAEWEQEKTQEFEERKKRKAERRPTDENENGVGKEAEESRKPFPRGAMLKLSNLPAEIDRDSIKKALEGLEANVAYVDMISEGVAYVRLRGENAGKQVVDKVENNSITINENKADISVLEGDDEEEYLKKLEEKMESMGNNFKGNRNNRRGGKFGRGRGGRGSRGGFRGRKRAGSPNGEGTAAKQTRSD